MLAPNPSEVVSGLMRRIGSGSGMSYFSQQVRHYFINTSLPASYTDAITHMQILTTSIHKVDSNFGNRPH